MIPDSDYAVFYIVTNPLSYHNIGIQVDNSQLSISNLV